jgi:hypothetical protein
LRSRPLSSLFSGCGEFGFISCLRLTSISTCLFWTSVSWLLRSWRTCHVR